MALCRWIATLAVVLAVGIRSSAQEPTCYPDGAAWQPWTSNAPKPLSDQRVNGVLPTTLPAVSLLASEAESYYWYFRNIQQSQAWAPCPVAAAQANQPAPAYPAPDGWRLLKVVHIKGIYNKAPADVPALIVLAQDKVPSALSPIGCKALKLLTKQPVVQAGHIVMLLRGTTFDSDNQYSLQYQLVTDPAHSTAGLVHKGAVNGSNQVWANGVQQLMDGMLATGCLPRYITVAGHSFGGVGATMLSIRMQRYLEKKWAAAHQQGSGPTPLFLKQPQPTKPPLVTAVMFGSPPVGNAAFVAEFNRRVNARKIEYENDPYNTIFQQWTPDGGKPNPLFSKVGGQVIWGSSSMPYQQDVWKEADLSLTSPVLAAVFSAASGKNVTGGSAWLLAVHSCSYLCKSGSFVKNSIDNWCLLHEEQPGGAGRVGTYCGQGLGNQFPTVPAFP